jgi:hypothetical protein
MPTHVRLQFSPSISRAKEIDGTNVHWSAFSVTEAVSRMCLNPPYNSICTLIPPKGDKSDFEQGFKYIVLAFDRPIVYNNIKVDTFGIDIKLGWQEKTPHLAIIQLVASSEVNSYVIELTATK